MMKEIIISEHDFDMGSNLHGMEHTQLVSLICMNENVIDNYKAPIAVTLLDAFN